MDFADVERLFRDALDRPADERAAWLKESRVEPTVRERVERLLRAHDALEDGDAGAELLDSLDAERAARLIGPEDRDLPGALRPGDHLGRYRIERRVGRGGMGTVYLAHDPELDRPVALKTMATGRETERLVDEARAASALDHPHVGVVYEIGETPGGERFIAMPWYGGGTLRERLATGPVPAETAIRIAAEVALGLGAAHAAGLVHRDIKPENIVFDADGRAKVIDFGLARRGRPSAPSKPPSGGTVPYMSPEQRRGDELDARADVWALGVVLQEMLTGVRPDPVSAAPTGTRALASVVERCLAEAPDERYSDGLEVARALERVVGRRSARRRARTLAVVGGCLGAVGIAVGVGLARGVPRVLDASGDATGAFPARGWAVVADFDATDGLADVGLAAREALAVDLQQSGFVRVASRAQVGEVLGRMGVDADAPLDLPLAMEVAERFGAGVVVAASVIRVGSRYVLSGRGYDPVTGAELFAVRASSDSARVLGAVERLSREVRARLGEGSEALARSLPLPEVTTTSLEALRLYAEAERALARSDPRAGALVAAAIAADSGFAMAHRLAAAVASGRLRFDEVAGHIERAWRHRDRLPERERWHVEAIYQSNALFQPGAAAQAYELLVARYPDDARAWHNLGVVRQSWLDDHEGAYLAFERAVVADSTLGSGYLNGISAAYMVGRPDEAARMAAAAEALGLRGTELRWRIARAFAEGDPGAVVSGCAELPSLDPVPAVGADDDEICGSMDVASGRGQSGVRRLRRSRDAALVAGQLRNAVQAAQGLAVAAVLAGDRVEAEQQLRWVLETIPSDSFPALDRFVSRVNLAVQAELLGLPVVAGDVLDAYPGYPDPDHWFARSGEALVRAARAVAGGRGEEALTLLDEEMRPDRRAIGWHVWEHLIRGLAQARQERWETAAEHLKEAARPGFLTSAFATKDRVHLPLVLHELARVEERRGDPAAIRAVAARRATVARWPES